MEFYKTTVIDDLTVMYTSRDMFFLDTKRLIHLVKISGGAISVVAYTKDENGVPSKTHDKLYEDPDKAADYCEDFMGQDLGFNTTDRNN